MNIKLRARLAAYAKVETLQPSSSTPGVDEGCDLITAGPVRGERIDTLFSAKQSEEQTSQKAAGAAIIDALFQKG